MTVNPHPALQDVVSISKAHTLDQLGLRLETRYAYVKRAQFPAVEEYLLCERCRKHGYISYDEGESITIAAHGKEIPAPTLTELANFWPAPGEKGAVFGVFPSRYYDPADPAQRYGARLSGWKTFTGHTPVEAMANLVINAIRDQKLLLPQKPKRPRAEGEPEPLMLLNGREVGIFEKVPWMQVNDEGLKRQGYSWATTGSGINWTWTAAGNGLETSGRWFDEAGALAAARAAVVTHILDNLENGKTN